LLNRGYEEFYLLGYNVVLTFNGLHGVISVGL
jgi:hypothetical protein